MLNEYTKVSMTHRFAGLMNEQQCYCVSRFGRNGPSSSCTIPCAADPTNYCGSNEAMSVFTTGQQGKIHDNLNVYLSHLFIY
jgi:hypothetical protein